MVLESVAAGRAALVGQGKDPPFLVLLHPRRALMLIDELRALGVPFALQIGVEPPEPPEDREWMYLGTILTDVHVYAEDAGP